MFKFIATKVDTPNLPKQDGWTPIHLASLGSHVDIVKFLASKVGNLNDPSPDGRAPWKIAADNNHPEVVLILLIAMDKRKSL